MKRFSLYLLLAAAVVACHENAPTVPTEVPVLATVGGHPTYVVSGAGSVVREDIEGSPREIYGFQAQVDADGNAWGEAEVHFPSDAVKMHIAIECLVVERNSAWMSGPVTRSDDPLTPIGRVFLWRVQDNGEGQGAPPDRISNFIFSAPDDLPPDICTQQWGVATVPWDNGGVQILTPGAPGLADLVGTWDATLYYYYSLPDLEDTLDVLADGREFRWTVAPSGRYSMVWWAPDIIFENVAGAVDVVNRQMIQTIDGNPTRIVLDDLRITGSTVSASGDFEFGTDWDGDGEEDPSHVVLEMRKKRTGLLIDDLAGAWDATVWRYTSTADASVTVDAVENLGYSITLTVRLDSRFFFVVEPIGWTSTTDVLLLDGNQMLTRNGDDSQAFVFTFEGDTWSFSGAESYDFDGDGMQDPAVLEVVLVRP
jgi:hypothetical protein